MRYTQKSLVGSSGKILCPWPFFFLPPPWNKDVMAGAPAVILDHNMTRDQNMLRMAKQKRERVWSPEVS